MKIKKYLSLVMSIVLALSLYVPALAADKDMAVGRSFVWSPFTSTDAINGASYTGTTLTRTYISAWTEFYWNKDGADEINSGYYTTMEQNALDGAHLSASDQYCDYANVHFDRDDDTGDGDYEESEVVLLGDVEANTEYVFNTYFERTDESATSGLINIIAQRSLNMVLEYNAIAYDLIEQADWHWDLNLSAVNSINNDAQTTRLSMEETSKLLVHDAGKTKSELNNYFSNQLSEFSYVLSVQPSAIETASTLPPETTKVTVTFVAPISMEEMLAVLENAGATLYRYKAKFINVNGEWCNASSSSTDEIAMIENANNAAANAGKPHSSYEGIISMEAYIPATQTAVDNLNASNLVFCVDTSEYIWTHSSDYNPNIKLLVPDYAWEVANF